MTKGSVIVTDNKAVVHSYMVPVVLDSIQEPGKRYVIADGNWVEVPNNITYDNLVWFQKEYKGGRNEAFKVPKMEWDAAGSKGKTYKVSVEDNKWSCTCPAYGWSGASRKCKHIDKIKTENGWN